MASSSSSVVARKGWTYDVFLSFRGEDTRNNFVDHLYAALTLKGIHTFKDDRMLGGGQPISHELVKAIKESRFAVVVFSKNYANSSWCLEELSKIMECHDKIGLKVLPVFYHVDPSNVRKQKGDFEAAFETYEDKFKGEMAKVNKWRGALIAASSLSGQHIKPDYGGEAEVISKIVQEIFTNRRLGGENYLIGIEPHIDALISLLKMEATEEVRFVGIWGMGGIGKTTIARSLLNRVAHNFEGSSFVSDVRENSFSKKDICALQQMISKDVLGVSHGFDIHDPEDGGQVIQERLCRKKVLVILDDVNDVKQIEYLAATREWFGPGSRIIITTRDQHVLSFADEKYRPALLHTDEALWLFSRHAFRESIPPDGYMDLSIRAINYASRLPLALKVLGSFLCGRQEDVWESALDRLAKTPNDVVFESLKLSYDYLDDFDKQIFLDIACFYKWKLVDDVTAILDSVIGISVLIEKSLITVDSNNVLHMHDLIQEMGWKIVQESAPNSRLWELEKIHDLIGKRENPNSCLWHLEKMHDLIMKTKKNLELQVIEGIVVPREETDKCFSLSPHIFESMKKLRILEVDSYFTCYKPTFLPDELRWFCWYKYPFSSVHVAHMSKLIGLDMSFGKIKHLWKEEKIMLQNLKFINLQYCESLKRFPDVSGAPNIERLHLLDCTKMVEVDESVGSLKKLLHLNLSHCWKLKRLPSMLRMESLKTLILSFCMSLKRIPEFSPCMLNLSELDINNCSKIKQVPPSIKYLTLTTLDISSCRKLEKLQDEFKSIEYLEELHIDTINLPTLTNFSSLRRLHLNGDIGDNDFPKNLHGLSCLKELHISGNLKLTKVPESISHLSGLKHLEFWYCSRLKTIHGLPSEIQVLIVDGSLLLEKIEDLTENYKCLYYIHLLCHTKLLQDEENRRYLDTMLDQSFFKKWAAINRCLTIQFSQGTLPSWFKEQQDGGKIALKLPPKWQSEIIGVAVCGVSKWILPPEICLRFENDRMLVPKWEGNNINETEEAVDGGSMWAGYIPFSLFKQFHGGGNYNDFEGEDWLHMTTGNLVIQLSCFAMDIVVRCGAKFVYKEDVASIQQTIPSISSFYQSWKLTKDYTNSLCTYITLEKNYEN